MPAGCIYTLKPSRWLAAYLASLHLLALAAVAWLPAHPGWRALLALLIAVSAWNGFRRWVFGLGRHAVTAIEPRDDGTLGLILNDGSRVEAEPLPDSTVLAHLVVVLARGKDMPHTYAMVFLPDSLDAEELRSLRVWLRWRAKCGNPAV